MSAQEPSVPNPPQTPTPESGEPSAESENPYEALKAQALQFIIRARQLAKDPAAVLQEVLKEIAD